MVEVGGQEAIRGVQDVRGIALGKLGIEPRGNSAGSRSDQCQFGHSAEIRLWRPCRNLQIRCRMPRDSAGLVRDAAGLVQDAAGQCRISAGCCRISAGCRGTVPDWCRKLQGSE